MKTSEKSKCIITLGLPQPDLLAAVYLGGSGIHNEWHVSTPACYLLVEMLGILWASGESL